MTDAEDRGHDDPLLGVRAWDRRPGEPLLWYTRFERFRQMGPSRSLRGLYTAERAAREAQDTKNGEVGAKTAATGPQRATTGHSLAVPKSWVNAARRWDWRKRAEAWDVAVMIQRREEQEQDRAAERERRLKLLRSFGDKLEKAIQHIKPKEVSVSELTGALRTLMEQMRLEYGEPSQRVDMTWRLREIADQMGLDPREVQDEYERLKQERQ